MEIDIHGVCLGTGSGNNSKVEQFLTVLRFIMSLLFVSEML